MLHKALLSSPKEFRVSIGTQTYCAASVNKSSAMPGDIVTVTVRANTGYGNVKVGVSPSVEVAKVNETTFTFVMPVTDVVVSASASALDFRINVSKTGQGTVTVKSLAKYGETVTVTVLAGANYELDSISASGVTLSGSGNTRTFVMPANDVTITVQFAEIEYWITIGYKEVLGTPTNDWYYGWSNGWGTPVSIGSINRVPYFNNNRSNYLRAVYANYSVVTDGPTGSYYFAGVMESNNSFYVTGTVYFNDGSTWTFNQYNDTGSSKGREIYNKFKKNNGTRAKIVFDQTPSGYL